MGWDHIHGGHKTEQDVPPFALMTNMEY